MIHVMEDSWSFLDVSAAIYCSEVYQWVHLKKIPATEILIEDIGYKPVSAISCKDVRYKAADLMLPALVVKGMENPLGKPYRLIDGRHRLLKAFHSGVPSLLAHTLTREDALKFIRIL
jgi:hypothetical protein